MNNKSKTKRNQVVTVNFLEQQEIIAKAETLITTGGFLDFREQYG